MQINATIAPSQMQRVAHILAFLGVGILCLLSDLSNPAKAALLIGIVGYALYRHHVYRSKARLIQLIHMDRQVWRWVSTRFVPDEADLKEYKDEGHLKHVHRIGWVVVLSFSVQTASKTQITSWLIWRDQVDAEDWRRLVVLARFWAAVETDAPEA